jgi:hypothetical protein
MRRFGAIMRRRGARHRGVTCAHAQSFPKFSFTRAALRQPAGCGFRPFLELTMKMKSPVAAALVLALSLPVLPSMAAMQRLDLLGDPAPPTAAGRTIVITPNTRFVNVQGGEVVRFDVGGKSFAWSFDGSVVVTAFDLARVAPPGVLDHGVMAYVSPNPLYIGGQ